MLDKFVMVPVPPSYGCNEHYWFLRTAKSVRLQSIREEEND